MGGNRSKEGKSKEGERREERSIKLLHRGDGAALFYMVA